MLIESGGSTLRESAGMKASEVRKQVLEDHTALRGMLDEIEQLADEFEHGNAEVEKTLRDRGLALYERFSTHLDLEDSTLAQALRSFAPSGEELADRLAREHEEQRELLRFLIRRLEEQSRPTILVARELRNFAGYLRYDMDHEEQTMLGEDVLSDRAAGEPA
jgi:hemerythrin-like domain-containing protein